MQGVAEFVKERLDILMAEQGGLVRAPRRKITKQRDGRALIFSVRQELAADDVELGEVIELSFAWEHIEVKHPKRFARGRIAHEIKLQIVDPFVRRRDLLKLQSKNVLIDGEHAIEHFLEWEKDAQRFLIDGEFL